MERVTPSGGDSNKKAERIRLIERWARGAIQARYLDQILGFLHACAKRQSGFAGATLQDLMLVGAGTDDAFHMLKDVDPNNVIELCVHFLKLDGFGFECIMSLENPDLESEIQQIVEEAIANLDKESVIQELVDKGRILKIGEEFFPKT